MKKLLLITIPFLLSAATYYVSPFGDNNNDGSKNHPWKSPGYATQMMKPGDTLIIIQGKYILQNEEDILSPPSGTASNYTQIIGEGDVKPTLAGRDNLRVAIDLSGKEYIKIENIEITHDSSATGENAYFREGINITGYPSRNIILNNLYIHHIDEFGIDAQDVENMQILNSRIEYCGFGALGGPMGEYGGWKNVTVSNCSLSYSGHYYQGGNGSNRPYDRPDGFGIEPSDGPVYINNTTAMHNFGDGLDSKAKNTIITNCKVAYNSCDGVKLWADGSKIVNTAIYGRGDGDLTPTPWAPIVIDQVEEEGASFEIINVTVDDIVGQNYLMYVQYDFDTPINLTIKNSIFNARGTDCPIYIHPSVNLEMDHNIFNFSENNRIITRINQDYNCETLNQLGQNNICADPNFKDVANGDLHLKDNSPAIDAADNTPLKTLALSTDLDNKLRFFDFPSVPDTGFGTPPIADIGAYEAQMDIEINLEPSAPTINDQLVIKINLDNKGITQKGDWWLAAQTPFGLYFYSNGQWSTNEQPLYQKPISAVTNQPILTVPLNGLPIGTYTIYFGVDLNADGKINWESLNYSWKTFYLQSSMPAYWIIA